MLSFTSCSLSFNGTNPTRGQLPQILYFSSPQENDMQVNILLIYSPPRIYVQLFLLKVETTNAFVISSNILTTLWFLTLCLILQASESELSNKL